MKNIVKRKIIVFFIILISVILLYFLFEDKFNLYIKKMFFIIICLFFFGVIFYLFKVLKKDKSDDYLEELKKMFSFSNKLLDSYYSFYNDALYLINSFLTENIDYKKDFERIYKSDNLMEKINSLYLKIDDLLNISNTIQNNYFAELKNKEKNHIDKNGLNKIAVNFKYNSEISTFFISSIINNIDKFSTPLSEGIYVIKLKIKDFVENISKWREEFNDEKSEKNFNNIIVKYGIQNEEFEKTVLMIKNNFDNLEKSLNNIVNMVGGIDKNTLAIQEISEKIRLLSINASIEAVRAGDSGKGFVIVSDEVKKLSNNTQSSVKAIVPIIKETKTNVSAVINKFNSECNNIIEKINLQKNEFSLFYKILKNYYDDLNSLFSSVSEVIKQINENIDKITPVFQSSNLSIQELENLNQIINKFLDENKDYLDIIINSLDENKKNEALENIIFYLKNAITTESEIEVINKIVNKYGLNKDAVKKSKVDIELF